MARHLRKPTFSGTRSGSVANVAGLYVIGPAVSLENPLFYVALWSLFKGTALAGLRRSFIRFGQAGSSQFLKSDRLPRPLWARVSHPRFWCWPIRAASSDTMLADVSGVYFSLHLILRSLGLKEEHRDTLCILKAHTLCIPEGRYIPQFYGPEWPWIPHDFI
jgi:hypothetical protein